MPRRLSRREFIATSIISATVGTLVAPNRQIASAQPTADRTRMGKPPLRLGLMTYNLAKDWDVDTIIRNCTQTKFEHVELRTTHAHGVEVSLTKSQRKDVKRIFHDAGLELSLASAFQYHYEDSNRVRENIEGTKEYTDAGLGVWDD